MSDYCKAKFNKINIFMAIEYIAKTTYKTYSYGMRYLYKRHTSIFKITVTVVYQLTFCLKEEFPKILIDSRILYLKLESLLLKLLKSSTKSSH